MLKMFNNYWVLGLSLILFYIIIKTILKCSDEKEEKFTSYLGTNIPSIVSFYIR
jgi:hypothetical protein